MVLKPQRVSHLRTTIEHHMKADKISLNDRILLLHLSIIKRHDTVGESRVFKLEKKWQKEKKRKKGERFYVGSYFNGL